MSTELINRGFVHLQTGRLQDAEAVCRQLLQTNPNDANAWRLYGFVAEKVGQIQFALDAFGKAVSLAPNAPEMHFSLANALRVAGKLDLAIEAYRAALRINPNYADALINIGIALSNSGQRSEAETHWKRALELDPNDIDATTNLGNHYRAMGRISDAIAFSERAIKIKPDATAAMNNLAFAYQQAGRLADAIATYRKLVALSPGSVYSYSNLLLNLQYDDQISPAEMFAEHRRWAEGIETPLQGTLAAHANDRSRDRRLRIGYVSPDFREHSISFFIEPVLEHHNRDQVEVFCYFAAPNADGVTKRLQSYDVQWRSIVGLRDAHAAEMIRKDQIDILVDLTVHTTAHRLRVFAHKPAPVQGTWLGYAGTTGLSTIDWRITDPIVDPVGLTEALHSEKLMRLPRTQWCYRPPDSAPEVSPGPVERNGFVTFGNATNIAKVTATTLDCWAKVVTQTPGARLAIKASSFTDEATRARMFDELTRRGVAPERVSLVAGGDMANYLAFFEQIDICLDTFPFAGGTTTCHTLHMGVPVVTRVGQTSVSRVGASVLTNVGLSDLVADSSDSFLRIATALAGDRDRLRSLRGELRRMMAESPLRDAKGFIRDLESAYRQMWNAWVMAQGLL